MFTEDPSHEYAHSASVGVAVPAETAFEFMASGLKQSYWALGSMERKEVQPGLFVGKDSFDGTDLYVRLDSDRDLLLVDYSVGPSPDDLTPAVEARIRRGSWLGGDESTSAITMTLWRWDGATDEEWRNHYFIWRTEMALIKGAIERGL